MKKGAERMKRAGKLLVIGLFSLLLSGCMFTTPETSLYRLPKLAGEYESLESQIDALLTNGAEYAAPTSGSNLQSVQMIDLDGDGSEEAVAFFRRASDKKPMKIYIFKANGDSYEQYACIEGTSTLIYSVNYADLDGDGRREILVGYRSSSDVQGLSIYPMTAGSPEASRSYHEAGFPAIHRASREVWLATQSMSTFMPRRCASATKSSKSSIVPSSGLTAQ